MAASGQLIPEWRHPSETTFIFDNTVIQDTEYVNTESVTFLSVFASSKGYDNKLLKKESLYSHIEEYGYPDYKRYGQASYIPYTALSSGNATCWEMRVMPQDASYANVIYAVEFKVIDSEIDVILNDVGDVTEVLSAPSDLSTKMSAKKLQVKFTPFTQENLNDAALFPVYMQELAQISSPDPDTEYYRVPYIGFRMLGRGEYGKYFRVRLSHDVASDKETAYKNYTLALISTEVGTVQKETFPALAFTEDAVDPRNNVTTFINEVVNDYEGDGSRRFVVEFMTDYHEYLYNFYKENVDPDTNLTLETFDIFGYDRTRRDKNNPRIEVVGGIGSVDLFKVAGVKFSSGSDGSFSDTTDPGDKEDMMDSMYLAAFSGELDPKINSQLRTPSNVILDANFSLEVKKAIAALVLKRKDMMAYLDCGLLTTVNQVKNYINSLGDIENYLISKNIGMFTTRDNISGKRIPVTVTAWLAYKIPMHWRQRGLYVAMAGEDYATVTGYLRNSILPVIDADDHETKEYFYDARWNYIECIAENTYIRGTQQTSQLDLSDLSEENNVHVLLQVKRRLERLCAQKRYHFGESSDRAMFTADAQELFSTWKGVFMRDISINFSMNSYEELRSILHCTCSIIFNTLIKRSVIEININPRA